MDYEAGTFQDFEGHTDAVRATRFVTLADGRAMVVSGAHCELLTWDVTAQ